LREIGAALLIPSEELEAQMNDASYLQRHAIEPLTERSSILGSRTRFAVLFLAFLGAAGSGAAQDAARKTEPRPEQVVIQAARLTDEQITLQAHKAISDDPWIYSEHITVTTQNGVIRVEGIVQDTWDWFRILDLCRKIRGARRVDTSGVELLHNDPEGGWSRSIIAIVASARAHQAA
jgi:hypothetical protein